MTALIAISDLGYIRETAGRHIFAGRFFYTTFGLHLCLLFNLILKNVLKNAVSPTCHAEENQEVNNIERGKVDCN